MTDLATINEALASGGWPIPATAYEYDDPTRCHEMTFPGEQAEHTSVIYGILREAEIVDQAEQINFNVVPQNETSVATRIAIVTVQTEPELPADDADQLTADDELTPPPDSTEEE